jgi:hypothetical protein
MSAPKPPKLVKEVDYYMEGDRFVFTATYHLKRGFCCHSRCRHCPYGLASDPRTPKIEIIGIPTSTKPTGD